MGQINNGRVPEIQSVQQFQDALNKLPSNNLGINMNVNMMGQNNPLQQSLLNQQRLNQQQLNQQLNQKQQQQQFLSQQQQQIQQQQQLIQSSSLNFNNKPCKLKQSRNFILNGGFEQN